MSSPVLSTPMISDSERQLQIRVEELLERTAWSKRPCKACGVTLWFVRHRNGALTPYTIDAVNHFANCPEAARFKRGAKRNG